MGRSLDGIRDALRSLGSPQDSYPVVLIGGTNGKGSTAAMVEEVAQTAGYRVGRFESPSWGEDHEHVRVDGRPVDRELFVDTFLRADDAGDLTWFEAVTAAAFQCFAEQRVDLAVVEVGMGGHSDCTNVVSEPIASAIVSVDLDHQQFLGSTIPEIAIEKAGIFRCRRPAVVGWVGHEAESAVRRESSRIGARLILCAEAFPDLRIVADGRARQRLHIGDFPEIVLPLAGDFQGKNAAVTILLAEQLRTAGFERIDSEIIARGLSQVQLKGRLEWLALPERPILLDSAHNPAAISNLVEYLEGQSLTPVDFLFGCFMDKDIATMLKTLLPIAGRIWPASSDHTRSISVERLIELMPGEKVERMESSALNSTLDKALGADNRVLCITGSMDLVADARRLLISKSP